MPLRVGPGTLGAGPCLDQSTRGEKAGHEAQAARLVRCKGTWTGIRATSETWLTAPWQKTLGRVTPPFRRPFPTLPPDALTLWRNRNWFARGYPWLSASSAG